MFDRPYSWLGIQEAVWGVIGVLIYLIVALIARRLILGRLSRVTANSRFHWDDVTLAALRGPLLLVVLASTAWVAERLMKLPPAWDNSLDQLTRVVLIVALILFLDKFLRGAVELYQDKLKEIHLTRGFAHVLTRLILLTVAALIILDTLQISITPLLASLGVGGLAIGLALQGTLSNLFAGMQIISDRPLRVGDFVKLESGEEGYVTEIGWRATKIRMLPNNTVVIPNSKLADSIVTNYYFPEPELAVLVQVGVSYQSDLAHVERVTIEVAKEIQESVAGAVRGFQPFIRYHTFDSSSINFSVVMRAREFVDNFIMKHEFIKRLHARYQAENIVIPWPIRTLNVPQELLDRVERLATSKGQADR